MSNIVINHRFTPGDTVYVWCRTGVLPSLVKRTVKEVHLRYTKHYSGEEETSIQYLLFDHPGEIEECFLFRKRDDALDAVKIQDRTKKC